MPRLEQVPWHAAVRLVPALLLVALPSHFAGRPYNSDEHRLIGDLGVAGVRIPPSVRFPATVTRGAVTRPQYMSAVKAAKQTAVGFATNDQGDYSKWKKGVQDNCYWTHFGQREYNLYIWIPTRDSLPHQVLSLPASTAAGAPAHFTFGALVALYGDYRRAPSCAGGTCFLTHADTRNTAFERGTLGYRNYCPAGMTTADYLRRIGSGLVPPFGTLGNQEANTAGDREFGEAGWWGDEMLRIANVNDWHFSEVAIAWYVGLHRLALLAADSARRDPAHWVTALHYEASALHSLTDLFAFGHVVTNRDESSYGMVNRASLTKAPAYRWMEHAIALGGGRRAGDGVVSLTGKLPEIAATAGPRDALLLTYRGTWLRWAKNEHTYHDTFNKSGAQVRNLNGDAFHIYGDGQLHRSWGPGGGAPVAVEAVRASVQALFDAYEQLEGGATVADLGSAGSPFFAALRSVPVFVEHDPNQYFLGRWTLYAHGVDQITGAGLVPADWRRCAIPRLTGKSIWWPDQQKQACTTGPGA